MFTLHHVGVSWDFAELSVPHCLPTGCPWALPTGSISWDWISTWLCYSHVMWVGPPPCLWLLAGPHWLCRQFCNPHSYSHSKWKFTQCPFCLETILFLLKLKMACIHSVWESCELTLMKKTWFILYECGICCEDALYSNLPGLLSRGRENCLGNCLSQHSPGLPRSLTTS